MLAEVRASTAQARRLLADRAARRRTTRRWASSSRAGAVHAATSRTHFMMPLVVGGVVVRPGASALRLPGPLPVRVPGQPRHARASPARRSGAPWSAARARYVERAAKELDRRATVARPVRARRRASTRRRRGRTTTPTAPSASTPSSSPPTRTRRCGMLADADRRRARGPLGAFGYSRNPTLLHTDTSRAARAAAAPGRRGTTCMPACDAGADAGARSATT